MSHVDDGILHAYLDGALDALSDAGELPDGTTAADVVSHLGTCADCRARLQREREIREGAGLVMADLPLPGAGVPELPALTASRARRSRGVALGWAASVVLAVGAGWIGSEVWRADSGPLPLERSGSTFPESAAFESAEAGKASDATAPVQASDDMASNSMPPAEPQSASAGIAASESPVRESTGASAAQAEARQPPAAADRAESVALAPPPLLPVPLGAAFARVDSLASRARLPMVAQASSEFQSARVRTARMHEMVAFDSIIAREHSGRIHFAEASPADVSSLADQIFVIPDASTPSIEAAREPGQTVVRVRQTTAAGEQIELITWRQHTVALDELVVTGTPPVARSRAQERNPRSASERSIRSETADAPQQDLAQAATDELTSARIRELDDDRRELVIETVDASIWIALRAEVSEAALRALARRLTVR